MMTVKGKPFSGRLGCPRVGLTLRYYPKEFLRRKLKSKSFIASAKGN
jgi:hypothetical protein